MPLTLTDREGCCHWWLDPVAPSIFLSLLSLPLAEGEGEERGLCSSSRWLELGPSPAAVFGWKGEGRWPGVCLQTAERLQPCARHPPGPSQQ